MLSEILYQAIEDELQRVVAKTRQPGLEEMHQMVAYHLGWEGEGAGAEARGKRIRPLLVLLSTAAAGGEWQRALPAAAAVELIHNFSLVHDDIQDQSPLRRGRPTVWTKWGTAQAINVGDTLFTLAQMALLRLAETVSGEVAHRASLVLQETCLALTQGQYLDISYESRGDLTLEAYWPMVSGKTAALLSACTLLGALAAQADEPVCDAYHRFGRSLGLAFQALDDLLGIWGDAALTGKSTESDLLSGKKSLPVLYGLSLGGPFAARWAQGKISQEDVPVLAAQLETEGGRAYTLERANELTDQALTALAEASPQGEAGASAGSVSEKIVTKSGLSAYTNSTKTWLPSSRPCFVNRNIRSELLTPVSTHSSKPNPTNRSIFPPKTCPSVWPKRLSKVWADTPSLVRRNPIIIVSAISAERSTEMAVCVAGVCG